MPQLLVKLLKINYTLSIVNSEFLRGFLICENLHMQSFVKIKSSGNGENTLLFTDIGKSYPSCKFLTSQIVLLMLFEKIKFSQKFPN